jgi:hypothetical protein
MWGSDEEEEQEQDKEVISPYYFKTRRLSPLIT